jgi:hypothetical protein
MKKVLSLLLSVPLFISASQDMTVYKVHPSAVRKTHEVGKLALYYTQGKFLAKQGKKKKREIGIECLDSSLRPMDIAKLSAILNHGYISVNKMSDGSLMLRSHVRGIGGGLWGAWAGAWAGKFAVHAGAQTVIWGAGALATLVGTPAAGAIVVASLQATLAVPTEIASNYAAIAGGIALGTATGPV